MQNQQGDDSFLMKPREGFDILMWIVMTHFACFQPFLRSGLGLYGMGGPGFFAGILIWVYAGLANEPLMIPYFWLWLAFVVARRITSDRTQNSAYIGWPWLASLVMFGSRNERFLCVIEAFLVFLIGALLADWSKPLGDFVAWGGASLLMREALNRYWLHREQVAMHDATVDMQRRAGLFQGRRR